MTLFDSIKAGLEIADTARETHVYALAQYQMACLKGDWEQVERVRSEILGSLEVFLDQFASAQRALNSAR